MRSVYVVGDNMKNYNVVCYEDDSIRCLGVRKEVAVTRIIIKRDLAEDIYFLDLLLENGEIHRYAGRYRDIISAKIGKWYIETIGYVTYVPEILVEYVDVENVVVRYLEKE